MVLSLGFRAQGVGLLVELLRFRGFRGFGYRGLGV